jgi:hypothetical protein
MFSQQLPVLKVFQKLAAAETQQQLPIVQHFADKLAELFLLKNRSY